MKHILPFILVMCAAAANSQTQPVIFKSPAEQVSLVELYTSEGCSSCPPAEAWLGRLKTSPRLWQDFVPIAFHVDYWDNLGWRDPFGRKTFSDRQRSYAARWQSDSIYTPGFVLNGREWRDWSRVSEPPAPPQRRPGTLEAANVGTNRWQVSFHPLQNTNATFQVHAALLGMELTSDVKAGENRGRKLPHDFVVLSLLSSLMSREGDSWQGGLNLATKPDIAAENLALAVWVTESGRLEPIQATGGWLKRAEK